MSQTSIGGLKAAATNRAKHGQDYYSRIGAMGGKVSRGGGFAADKDRARAAGRKGGLGRRGYRKDFLFYEQLNDANAPLFVKTPSLIERFNKYYANLRTKRP